MSDNKDNIVDAINANGKAEVTLRILAKVMLFLGLLVALILLCASCFAEEFNLVGFLLSIGIAVSSVITWAFLCVVVNISNKLSVIATYYGYVEQDVYDSADDSEDEPEDDLVDEDE